MSSETAFIQGYIAAELDSIKGLKDLKKYLTRLADNIDLKQKFKAKLITSLDEELAGTARYLEKLSLIKDIMTHCFSTNPPLFIKEDMEKIWRLVNE